MKKNILTFTIYLLSLFLVVPNAYAHVLKSDGSIGAVMHVNPEDDPIVGQESSFFFEFKDKKNTFKPQDCDCHFSVLQNSKELFTQPLFQNNSDPSLANASVSYTFAEKGVYKIKVTGKSLSDNTFDPFTLEYDIRVERTVSENAQPQNDNWFIAHIPPLVGGLIGFSVLGFVLFKGRPKK
jgi:hypothetical protein